VLAADPVNSALTEPNMSPNEPAATKNKRGHPCPKHDDTYCYADR